MLEISACMELKAKSREQVESTDEKYSEISFEELLAQEKKDSFWLVANIQPPPFFFPKTTKSLSFGMDL